MQIYIKKLIIHNFLSYGHSEIDLTDKHYCLVSGINNNPRDNALSNGSGKCFGKGTLVLMADGTQKCVEDIQVGDQVMGWDGTTRQVLETHSGEGNLYKVAGNFGYDDYSYICNENHILTLKKTCGNNSKNYPKHSIIDIPLKDYLNIDNKWWKITHNQFIVPIKKFPDETADSELLIDPYILGLWLGDGSKSSISLTSADQELVDTWNGQIKNFPDYHINVYGKYQHSKALTYGIVKNEHNSHPNLFKENYKHYGLLLNKHIPLKYLTSSWENRLKLLAGLIDTDGWVQQKTSNSRNLGYYCITQKSDILARDILQLARSLGFKCGCKKYLNKKYNVYYNLISITGEVWNIPVKLDRKKILKHNIQRPYTIKPTVTPAGFGNYYGFTIDGDGRFLLANNLVVHNSSWGSAICWALTGQTVNGLSKNIKNINIDEKSCYVTLEFKVDNDEYKITRYAEPKSDLTIIVNNEDVSGKGIRESELVLAKYLPDLTSQLIASIIILGQGLPCKFTSNSPSGRKEVLEKLSKSDFMIQDLKDRLSTRLNALNSELRTHEDRLLVLNTNAKNNEICALKLENKLKELQTVRDFDKEINGLKILITEAEKTNKKLDEDINIANDSYTKLTDKINEINEAKMKELNDDNTDFNAFYSEYLSRKSVLDSNINSLNIKITQLKNIKDVCPTCGQKLPNVIKPSTEVEEKELNENKQALTSLNEKYNAINSDHLNTINEINKKYQVKSYDLNTQLNDIKKKLAELHSTKKIDLIELNSRLTKIELEKQNYNANLKQVNEEIEQNKLEKENLTKDITSVSEEIQTTNDHIKVINQLNTLIKRDFRGYLLKDIIDYINLRAKDYSQLVFGTTELDFTLDGNNIDISYCNKDFSGLSGGEKQKVDLIIQLAIRDMMKNYLGFSSNILILDEVTDYLDEPGCAAILNLINNKLTDVESIFIISHHADELSIPYDCEMIVVKDEKGVSTIKWQ